MLRTPQTVELLRSYFAPPGQLAPLLQYFGIILEHDRLTEYETIELSNLLISQNKKELLKKWFDENKLTCSETFGDIVQPIYPRFAAEIYKKSKCHLKVVESYMVVGLYSDAVEYAKNHKVNPDYGNLLSIAIKSNPLESISFAKTLLSKNPPVLTVGVVFDAYFEGGHIDELCTLMKETLQSNTEESGPYQTRLLEILFDYNANMAADILSKHIFNAYDKDRIGRLCENNNMIMLALENYTSIDNIKRLIVRTDVLDFKFINYFLLRLSVSQVLECLSALLKFDLSKHLKIVVEIASGRIGDIKPSSIIILLESFNCDEGLLY